MGIRESNVGKKIRMALSKTGARLFRINTGTGWTGNKIVWLPKNHDTWPGALVIYDPRPFSSGTPVGYADYTGWKSITVSEEMVGQTLAVFMAVEVKAGTSATKEQQNFIERVLQAGGIAGVVRSPEDALALLDGSSPGNQGQKQQ